MTCRRCNKPMTSGADISWDRLAWEYRGICFACLTPEDKPMDPAYESAQRHLKDKVTEASDRREAQVMMWAFELYRDARRAWLADYKDLNSLDLREKHREDVIQECKDDARAFAKGWV